MQLCLSCDAPEKLENVGVGCGVLGGLHFRTAAGIMKRVLLQIIFTGTEIDIVDEFSVESDTSGSSLEFF